MKKHLSWMMKYVDSRFTTRAILTLAGLILVCGCVSPPQETHSSSPSTGIQMKDQDGRRVHFLLLQSDKSQWVNQEKDVRQQLASYTSHPRYEIVQMNTNYVEGYLLNVELYFVIRDVEE